VVWSTPLLPLLSYAQIFTSDPILKYPQLKYWRPILLPYNYSCVYLEIYILETNCKTKYSAPNDNKHSLTSTCHFRAVSGTWTGRFLIVGILLKYDSFSGEVFSAYRSSTFTFSPFALFKIKSGVKRRSALESLSITLKLLRTCDMVDFNSNIANFWPENRKNICHCFCFKFDTKLNCRRKLDEEGN
jgi:hypothetical protein